MKEIKTVLRVVPKEWVKDSESVAYNEYWLVFPDGSQFRIYPKDEQKKELRLLVKYNETGK